MKIQMLGGSLVDGVLNYQFRAFSSYLVTGPKVYSVLYLSKIDIRKEGHKTSFVRLLLCLKNQYYYAREISS